MPNPNSVSYKVYLEETKDAIEKCYPIKEKTEIIGATTLLKEINKNPIKYPLYSKIKSDRHKKLIITNNCVYDLKWGKWGNAHGSGHAGPKYIRPI